MAQPVLGQGVAAGETSTTFIALKWSYTGMFHHMEVIGDLSGKVFGAFSASKWFLLRVGDHVSFQGVSQAEYFVTYLTLE